MSPSEALQSHDKALNIQPVEDRRIIDGVTFLSRSIKQHVSSFYPRAGAPAGSFKPQNPFDFMPSTPTGFEVALRRLIAKRVIDYIGKHRKYDLSDDIRDNLHGELWMDISIFARPEEQSAAAEHLRTLFEHGTKLTDDLLSQGETWQFSGWDSLRKDTAPSDEGAVLIFPALYGADRDRAVRRAETINGSVSIINSESTRTEPRGGTRPPARSGQHHHMQNAQTSGEGRESAMRRFLKLGAKKEKGVEGTEGPEEVTKQRSTEARKDKRNSTPGARSQIAIPPEGTSEQRPQKSSHTAQARAAAAAAATRHTHPGGQQIPAPAQPQGQTSHSGKQKDAADDAIKRKKHEKKLGPSLPANPKPPSRDRICDQPEGEVTVPPQMRRGSSSQEQSPGNQGSGPGETLSSNCAGSNATISGVSPDKHKVEVGTSSPQENFASGGHSHRPQSEVCSTNFHATGNALQQSKAREQGTVENQRRPDSEEINRVLRLIFRLLRYLFVLLKRQERYRSEHEG